MDNEIDIDELSIELAELKGRITKREKQLREDRIRYDHLEYLIRNRFSNELRFFSSGNTIFCHWNGDNHWICDVRQNLPWQSQLHLSIKESDALAKKFSASLDLIKVSISFKDALKQVYGNSRYFQNIDCNQEDLILDEWRRLDTILQDLVDE